LRGPGREFLAKWQDIFVPARDDAIVLHNLGAGVLFYCHEEELEYGHRKAQSLAAAADSPRAEVGQLVQGMRVHPQTHSPSERACRFGNDIVAG
jgi:hypothetical protein